MRIEGYIDHPTIKITVMKMNDRFTVKLEDQGLEQSYKFRQSESLSNFEDIKKLIDEEFIDAAVKQFVVMASMRKQCLEKNILPKGQQFPYII